MEEVWLTEDYASDRALREKGQFWVGSIEVV